MKLSTARKFFGFSLVLLVLALASMLLPAQEEAKEKQGLQLTVSDHVPAQAKQVATVAWPNVKKACPGLDKYASALEVKGITDELNSYISRVIIRIKVTDEKSDIPDDYGAWGHYCDLDISPDAKTLTVAKDCCVSVLLDRPYEANGRNVTIPLQ